MTLWLTPADEGEERPSQRKTDVTGARRSAFLNGKSAVIVEDEGMTVWQLKRMLTLAGIKVVGAAADGREGVETALRERPDLVLMDMTMPVMNGLEATRLILQEFTACIVMVTAYEEYRTDAEQLGTCGYITKPVSSETLLPVLEAAYREWLRRHGAEPSA